MIQKMELRLITFVIFMLCSDVSFNKAQIYFSKQAEVMHKNNWNRNNYYTQKSAEGSCTLRKGLFKRIYTCTNLYEFPKDIPKSVTRLIIECSVQNYRDKQILLSNLPPDGLKDLIKLKEIQIIGCPITFISSRFFENTIQLKKLHLENLPLAELEGDIFLKNSNLEMLSLIKLTNMEKLDPIILAGQQKLRFLLLSNNVFDSESINYILSYAKATLRTLIISEHRVPLKLQPECFRQRHFQLLDLTKTMLLDTRFLELTSVTKLKISGTMLQIGEVKTNIKLKAWKTLVDSLEIIDVSQSTLYSLFDMLTSPYEIFLNVRLIDARRNLIEKIHDINDLTKINFPNLNRLNLRHNSILQMPEPRILMQLPVALKLYLDGNPIHCNCILGELNNKDFINRFSNFIPCNSMAVQSLDTNYVILSCPSGTFLSDVIERYKTSCQRPILPEIITTDDRVLPITNHYHRKREEKVYFIDLSTNNSKARRHVSLSSQIMCTTTADPIPTIQWDEKTSTGYKLISTTEGNDISSKQYGSRYAALLDIQEQNFTNKEGNVTLLCTARNNVGEARTKMIIQLSKPKELRQDTYHINNSSRLKTKPIFLYFLFLFSTVLVNTYTPFL